MQEKEMFETLRSQKRLRPDENAADNTLLTPRRKEELQHSHSSRPHSGSDDAQREHRKKSEDIEKFEENVLEFFNKFKQVEEQTRALSAQRPDSPEEHEPPTNPATHETELISSFERKLQEFEMRLQSIPAQQDSSEPQRDSAPQQRDSEPQQA